MLILSLEVTLYSPANKADFQMNGFVPGFGFDKSASRKGLFNFVLLLSRACNLQTAQSQTSVLNDTLYWSKFHFSGDLVTELKPTLNENISLFFLSCQPYSLPVSPRVSSCIDWSAHHPCVHTRTGYQYYPVTLYLYLYQVQRWVFLDMVP